jgi:hypothetical protein
VGNARAANDPEQTGIQGRPAQEGPRRRRLASSGAAIEGAIVESFGTPGIPASRGPIKPKKETPNRHWYGQLYAFNGTKTSAFLTIF